MAFYLISIIGADALIAIINILLNEKIYNLSNTYIIICSVLCAVILMTIDGITAALVRRCLPSKWFTYKVKFHLVSKKECKFYELLGIKKWKDHVIELGMFTSFSKKTIADPKSAEYLERFILESNYGAMCHLANAIFGFLTIFCFPLEYMWNFAFPASVVNAFLSMLPYAILRYNLPRLHKMLEITNKRNARANNN